MAKKRRKARARKKPLKKSKPPRKHHKIPSKTFVLIAFGCLILVLILPKLLEADSNVKVSSLRVEQADAHYVHFELSHNLQGTRDCFAEITFLSRNEVIKTTHEDLGKLDPNQKVLRTIKLEFPAPNTDFRIDINCE